MKFVRADHGAGIRSDEACKKNTRSVSILATNSLIILFDSGGKLSTQSTQAPTKWTVAGSLGVAGSLIVVVVVLAFLWPTKASSAQDIPLSIVGSPPAVSEVQEAVSNHSPGVFTFVPAPDREAAIVQIQGRETYGAIVLGNGTMMPEVLTAPAAGGPAAQMLGGVAAQLQVQLNRQAAVTAIGGSTAAAGVTVTVTPIVPLSGSDPTGSGLVGASFPLTMGGMIGGIFISMLVVGAVRRLAALVGFGVAVGIALALVLQAWFGFLQGSFWINAAAMSLSVVATASFILGCTSLFGAKGISIGASLTMLIGNPLSSATTPWQFLPEPWGLVGQLFVPGASNWLIRSLSYFPDTDVTAEWCVLAAWAGVGLALTLIGHFRAVAVANAAATPADLEEPELENTSLRDVVPV